MKKIALKLGILLISLLLWTAILFRFTNIRMWIPTDFSEDRAQLATVSAKETGYYYNSLTENGKIAYNRILAEIREHPEEINVPNLDAEEFKNTFHALSFDNPDLLCMRNESKIVKRGAKSYFLPQYTCDVETCNAHTAALHAAAEEIVNGISAGQSTYEIELYLHDTVCARMVYEEQEDLLGHNAYDALVSGKAVCEGYARALQLLLNRAGIPNYLVTGKSINSVDDQDGHMWNLVTIDGQNYYLDATWNDLDIDGLNRYSHAYFNLSDTDITGTYFELEPAENHCAYEQYNYFVQENLLFSAYDSSTCARITECIQETLQMGGDTFEIRFASREVYDQAFDDLIENGEMYTLAQKADRKFLKKYSDIMYVDDEQMLTVQFTFV